MAWNLLAIFGLVLGGIALRSFSWVVLRKLGAVCYLAATYWAGWKLLNHHLGGILAVSAWFFLPWLEILGRVRHLRLPLDKPLKGAFAPSEEKFPQLDLMTESIEETGFSRIEDARFDSGTGSRQFLRIFYHNEKHLQAVIHFLEQEEVMVSWASLTTRTTDGRSLTTWTFPFSQTMKTPPESVYNTVSEVENFEELLEHHQLLLGKHKADAVDPISYDPEELAKVIERETRRQVDHNLDVGVIRLSGDGTFRYSWRGYLFLWRQFVIDMLRLS